MANPGKQVVNIAGDGSFHMNANELSTAAKYNIPIIELLFNNEVLGMVRQWQKLFYDGRFSQTTLEKKTNYEKLAEAYGVKAMTLSLIHIYLDTPMSIPAGKRKKPSSWGLIPTPQISFLSLLFMAVSSTGRTSRDIGRSA